MLDEFQTPIILSDAAKAVVIQACLDQIEAIQKENLNKTLERNTTALALFYLDKDVEDNNRVILRLRSRINELRVREDGSLSANAHLRCTDSRC